jgi:two-component system, cell cycle sensor histidine kinase and response regulator CckA
MLYRTEEMEPESERAFRERTLAFESAIEALRQDRQRLEAELDVAARLQSVATQLISTRGTAELYEEILDATRAILHADFASIQMFHPERGTQGELRLLGHRGFSEEAATHWEWVRLTAQTAWGQALRTGRRVVVPDVRDCDFMAGSDVLQVYLSAGIKAVQTTPLVSRAGVLVGMVSTHWREIHEPTASELRALDVLARMAADLIERSRVEEALRESQQHLALAQNAARLGVWHCDLRTNITVFSGEYARLYGLQPDHPPLPHDEWLRLVHPSDREQVEMLLRESIANTHSWDAEFRVVWPDGSTHWLLGKGEVFLDDSGAAVRMAGVNLDITGRKEAEAKLRESEERFRRVFEEGPLGVALVARDSRFLKVNGALCQMVGYTEEELIQKRFADITHPNDVRADVELAEQLFKREIPFYRIQKRYVKKTGEIVWINLTASLLCDRDGDSLQRLTMIEDITEIKRTQEEALSRQKLEAVGTLAGGIAHDFNNLLGAVVAQADLAQAELAAGSSPEEELKAIRDVAMRGSEIVRELMIYAGKESEALGLVDVSQIVEEMLGLLKVSVSKHARLDIDLGHLPAIRASAAQISQLVINLATNASEAIGDRDGVIRMTTRRVMVGHGSRGIESLADGEYVQLEVSDTGRGMSPETQARAFDPFFSTKSGGRGLGLAVVYGIVRDLGGAINLVSELNHGTTFQILLPCTETPPIVIPGPVSHIGRPTPPSPAATVLVVEDEDPLRQAVSKMLGKHGFSVIEAPDGSTALDVIRAQNNPLHVLLLDITLPGTSSREVLQEARRLRPELRVIVTSAYTEEMAAASLQGAIEHFVQKPYRLYDLVRLIDAAKS